jgi:hypothetical protein
MSHLTGSLRSLLSHYRDIQDILYRNILRFDRVKSRYLVPFLMQFWKKFNSLIALQKAIAKIWVKYKLAQFYELQKYF